MLLYGVLHGVLKNTYLQQKIIHQGSGSQICVLASPSSPPLQNLVRQVLARDKALPTGWVTFRPHHKQLLFQSVWRVYRILKYIFQNGFNIIFMSSPEDMVID